MDQILSNNTEMGESALSSASFSSEDIDVVSSFSRTVQSLSSSTGNVSSPLASAPDAITGLVASCGVSMVASLLSCFLSFLCTSWAIAGNSISSDAEVKNVSRNGQQSLKA